MLLEKYMVSSYRETPQILMYMDEEMAELLQSVLADDAKYAVLDGDLNKGLDYLLALRELTDALAELETAVEAAETANAEDKEEASD